MQTTHSAITHFAAAQIIISTIYRAAITSQHGRLDRRLLKYVEEFGEVAEAFLDTTGSNRKGKTTDDLLEEKVDMLVVSADTVMQHGRLIGADMQDLKRVLTEDLAQAIDADNVLEHEAGMSAAAILLGAAMRDLAVNDDVILGFTLMSLQSATARLLFIPEALDANAEDSPEPPSTLHRTRLVKIIKMVKAKVAKWEMTRALPNAA